MPNTADDIAKSFFDKFKEGLKTVVPELKDFADGIEYMIAGAEKVSTQFGIGRTRMSELMGAITEATPAIDRLGGNLRNVEETMNAVSKATNRNVVAGTKDISKLFAAQQALGLETEGLVEKFQEVGVNFSQIGQQLETSMNYIQNVGGNARDIMRTMLQDMSSMNRFNFQNGVEGFTKMATQASILKIEMRTTLDLAERALDPDGAIELASAFQRLGVSVGELTDPFQLMNMSLNDPEGLQNSIVEMSKQFTSFDEKTKSFKINPQGMLMMREIGKQTGINASELSKMALNASELDRKLSQISPSINFTKEEDRQLLANIATMRADGKYEITYGEDDKIELEKLTQNQVDELIKQQAKAPKTLEDLQRSQMDTMNLMKSDLRAVKDKIVYGIVSQRGVRTGFEGARQAGTAATGALEEVSPSVKSIRTSAEDSVDAIKDLISTMKKEGSFGPESMKLLQTELAKLDKLGESGDEKVQEFIDKLIEKNADNTTDIGKLVQKMLVDDVKKVDEKKKTTETKTGDIGKGAEHIGAVMKETNVSLSTKMEEANKLSKEGNDKLGNIADGLNKNTTTGKDNSEIGGVLKETNVSLSTKMEEANKLAKEGNDKLGSIADGLNKNTTTGKNNNEIGGVLSENLVSTFSKLQETQAKTNDGLMTLTEAMKKFNPQTITNSTNPTNNTTNNTNSTNQSVLNINPNPINPNDVAKLTQNTTNTNISQTSTKDVNFAGTVTIKIDAPPGVSTQYLTEFVNSTAFHENIYKIWKEKSDELSA